MPVGKVSRTFLRLPGCKPRTPRVCDVAGRASSTGHGLLSGVTGADSAAAPGRGAEQPATRQGRRALPVTWPREVG